VTPTHSHTPGRTRQSGAGESRVMLDVWLLVATVLICMAIVGWSVIRAS
jgi:hypothetical protein